MPTLNSVTKTARITGSDWEVIEQYMNKQEITFSGLVKEFSEKIRNPQGVHPQNTDLSKYGITLSIIADFEVILNIYDTNFEGFFKKLYEKVRDGEIDVEEVMK